MSDPQDPQKRPSGEPASAGADDKTVEQPLVDGTAGSAADETVKNETPADGAATEDVVSENAEQAPPKATETPSAAPTGPPAGAPQWVPQQQAAKRSSGFRRFAGARATQLVGVGLIGFILGGGIIGTAVGLASRDGGRPDRPGFSREYRGGHDGGPHRDFRDGPGDRGWRGGN